MNTLNVKTIFLKIHSMQYIRVQMCYVFEDCLKYRVCVVEDTIDVTWLVLAGALRHRNHGRQ